MIPVSSLHYGILQQANHTDSEYLSQTSASQRDYYINTSKDDVLEWLASLDDNNESVRRHLQSLTIRRWKMPVTVKGNEIIASYPDNLYKPKAFHVIAKREGCPDRRMTVRRPTSEKYQKAVLNPNTNRIWDFEQTFAQEAFDGFYIVTEPGVTMDVYMDYIRKIPDVAYPSGAKGKEYIRHDGERVTEDVNLDTDSTFIFNKIVALATLKIKRDYFEVGQYQADKDFILTIDKN